ncbi:BPSL0067 family protein [Escherichia coli]|uniref:BPSL0067 family protein n=1 Tax=Escherichia coli TaxID=562 RepID=A0A8T5Z7D9_ECOLX|nr:BPSL0067 family protein [Escherichia coli]EFN8168879.1 hypothetical protein [Escherichia coli]EHK7395465.1 BPSL0067 family protein [Escherichia coli]MBA0907166.1 BPSL0067 family protein [Escherichia coli]MRG19537.1 BPSL0067 family protein [Escherichia coli]MWR36590.1 BPSL0067 family protein [Escherichia coli]
MSRVYESVDLLQGQPLVEDGECVTLVKRYAHLGSTATWRAGKKVWGDTTIPKGTAIATFFNGRWPGRSSGNHAAFYLGQDKRGIWVMDQWRTQIRIEKHQLRPKGGANSDGSYPSASSNAEAFYVIE